MKKNWSVPLFIGLMVVALAASIALVGCPQSLISWYRYIGTNFGDDGAYAVIVTADKGYAIAGFTESDHAMDNSALVIKLDQSGAEAWRALYDDGGDDIATAIAQTPDGGYLVAGTSMGELLGQKNVFLLKLNTAGAGQWSRLVTVEGSNEVRSIVPLSDGGCILALQLDTHGASDVVLRRYDSVGSMVWSYTAATAAHAAQAVATTNDGAAIAWWTLDPEVTPDGMVFTGAAAIQAVDNAGAPAGRVDIPLDEPAEITCLATMSDGGYLLGGQGNLFDDDSSGIVIRVDNAGQVAWTTPLGEDGRDRIHDIVVTPGGRIAVAGEFGLERDHPHMYLAVLLSSGAISWQRTYGADDLDIAYSLGVTSDGGFVLAGMSESEEQEGEVEHLEILVVKTASNGAVATIETD